MIVLRSFNGLAIRLHKNDARRLPKFLLLAYIAESILFSLLVLFEDQFNIVFSTQFNISKSEVAKRISSVSEGCLPLLLDMVGRIASLSLSDSLNITLDCIGH